MLVHGFLHAALDGLRIQFLGFLAPAADGQVQAHLLGQLALQALQVPLLVHRVRRHEAGDGLGDHVAADAVDVLLHRFGFEQLVALAVDRPCAGRC